MLSTKSEAGFYLDLGLVTNDPNQINVVLAKLAEIDEMIVAKVSIVPYKPESTRVIQRIDLLGKVKDTFISKGKVIETGVRGIVDGAETMPEQSTSEIEEDENLDSIEEGGKSSD